MVSFTTEVSRLSMLIHLFLGLICISIVVNISAATTSRRVLIPTAQPEFIQSGSYIRSLWCRERTKRTLTRASCTVSLVSGICHYARISSTNTAHPPHKSRLTVTLFRRLRTNIQAGALQDVGCEAHSNLPLWFRCNGRISRTCYLYPAPRNDCTHPLPMANPVPAHAPRYQRCPANPRQRLYVRAGRRLVLS